MDVTSREIERTSWTETTTAPNGSSTGTDRWTKIVFRQTWADVPENGPYAGREYRVTRWTVNGTSANSTSEPWN